MAESPVQRLFSEHENGLRSRREARRQALTLRPITNQLIDAPAAAAANSAAGGGGAAPTEEFDGDLVLQTLNNFLQEIDRRGYARSAHQLQFHNAFIRACGRVIYRHSWGVARPTIMAKNGWAKSPSEILISTPRRFGKTFSYANSRSHPRIRALTSVVCLCSIAIFCACLALSTNLEIVIFSPARRASRKLLERIVEFLRLLDKEDSILEFNQEQCRLRSANGKTSLIRSFPSKVSVRKTSPSNSPTYTTPTRMQHQTAAITRICRARRCPRRREQRRSTGARSPASPPAARPTGR